MASINKFSGLMIQRDTALFCARVAKRQGDMKNVRHFVRGARRRHAKAMQMLAAMVPADVNRVSKWREI